MKKILFTIGLSSLLFTSINAQANETGACYITIKKNGTERKCYDNVTEAQCNNKVKQLEFLLNETGRQPHCIWKNFFAGVACE